MAYIVYKITHCLTGGATKAYVGVTRRTLDERLKAHLNESTRKKTRGLSPFSLGYAIREHLRSNPDESLLRETFVIEELETCTSVEEMLVGEVKWMAELDTMAPIGYNLMRGGSSAGGPSNSKPCTIFLGDATRDFTSITAAAEAVALFKGIHDADEVRRFQGRVRARLNSKAGMGWTLAAALELEPREDLRITALSRSARANGENIDTVRSRDFRKKKADLLANVKQVSLIPHPEDPGKRVSITEGAMALGVPKSTLQWRLDQIRTSIGTMTPEDILAHLKRPQDRVKQIEVVLPGGERIKEGYNGLARRFQREGNSVSAIKSRLRKLGPAPGNDDLLIAIGEKAAPGHTRLVHSQPVSRKKHCDDWTVSHGGSTCQFINQADFVSACVKLLSNSTSGSQHLGPHPQDSARVRRRIQDIVRRMTAKGHSAEEVAEHFGIREELSNHR